MSLGHGAKIVTDGLVFAYDMGNEKKSWKGKPITNLWAANKSTYSWTTGTGTVTRNIPTSEMPPPFDFTGVEVVKVESTSDVFGTILWTVPGIEGPDVTYAHSIWVYVVDADSIGIGQHWNPWSYNHLRYPTPGRWERIEHINTTVDNTHTSVAIQYNVNKVGGGGIAYFCAPQYEKNSFVTPFVNGTRSNTGALLDMVGGNTITMTDVTYNSDNTFQFDGTTDIATIPIPFDNTQPYTILMWVEPISLDMNSAYRSYNPLGTVIVGPGPLWNPGIWVTHNTIRSHCRTAYVDNLIDWSDLHPTLMGMVFDGTTCYNIFDGQLITTGGTYTSYSPGSPTTLQIGAYSASSTHNFNGKIYSTQIYNKALTADEVKQNFNALRGRYGL